MQLVSAEGTCQLRPMTTRLTTIMLTAIMTRWRRRRNNAATRCLTAHTRTPLSTTDSVILQCTLNEWLLLLLLLLVWHAPLGVRSAKRRHQSPEWTILSHSYRHIQWEIVRPQVLLDSLHPCSSRTSWWSPPVLRSGSSYDTPGICLVWHSRNVAEQRKTPCLDNSRQAWLPSCPSHLVIPHVTVPFDSSCVWVASQQISILANTTAILWPFSAKCKFV